MQELLEESRRLLLEVEFTHEGSLGVADPLDIVSNAVRSTIAL